MILDTSAVVAILNDEPERSAFAAAITNAARVSMSAATYLEAGIVVDALKRSDLSRELDDFLLDNKVDISPFTPAQARIAREAYRDFGKGSGHAARLNYGDCIAYALAKDLREPLLFKGTDFAHTDVKRAV